MRENEKRGEHAWVPLLGWGVVLAGTLALTACVLTGSTVLDIDNSVPGRKIIKAGFSIGITRASNGTKHYGVESNSGADACLNVTWTDSKGKEISSETVKVPASGSVPEGAATWEATTVECPEDEEDVTSRVGPPALGHGLQYRHYLVMGGPVTLEPGASDPSRHASYSFWVEARDAAAASALVAPIVAGGPGTPVPATVEVLYYSTLVPTTGGALMVTAVREPFDSYRLDWNGEVGYGDLASGHNANQVSLANGWWAVQSVVQEADFVDDPSTPGVDYRNTAELEYSVPSDGVRKAAVEVVHRYQ